MFILIWTKRTGRLDSVHRIPGHSAGAILFPISLILCAALFWPISPQIFQGAALVLGVSDGFAGLVGRHYGRCSYRLTGPKTVEGSLTFFGLTAVILLLTAGRPLSALGPAQVGLIIGGTLLLTLVEAALSRGWDNLPVPLLAGAILIMLGQ